MAENFQRLLTMSAAQPLSMNAQAALGAVRVPRRSQFTQLVQHFLERFFNHETASADGNGKARMILIAFATGLPGFVVALYLWPDYHSLIPHMRNHHMIWTWGPPPYWIQVNQHLFFVVYSFVALGIATVFEWDLFFPDLLDLWVLKTLPIAERRVFAARVAAIAIFLAGFLFDANIFATVVLPSAIDPPNLFRFLAAHVLATGAAGLFAALSVLVSQGVLLSILGERWFRRISLAIQSLAITALLMLLLLFPVFSAAVPTLLQSRSWYAFACPPFWFIGMYQSIMEGPAALPVYSHLATIGWSALVLAAALGVLFYPVAYLRRVRQLIEGPGARSTRSWLPRPFNPILHATILRRAPHRAVFHFISQTVTRVPRYRIYLVLYGGVGFAVIAAALLRFAVTHGKVHVQVSPDGIRATAGIVAFWIIAGLRMAFTSSGNRQGNWVFRIVHGRPPELATALQLLWAAKTWVLLSAGAITLLVALLLRLVSPAELLKPQATAAQLIVAGGLCLLLTDAFFLNVTAIAFTGEPQRDQPNFALTVLKYFTFFPAIAAFPPIIEPWMEASVTHVIAAILILAGSHLVLAAKHRALLRQHCAMQALEDDEEDFPMKLGLRY